MTNEYSDEVNEQMEKHISELIDNLSIKRRERLLSYMDSYFEDISADVRLLEQGYEAGFVSNETYKSYDEKLNSERSFMGQLWVSFKTKTNYSVKHLDRSFKAKG